MPASLWRLFAVLGASIALVFIVIEAADVSLYADSHLRLAQTDGHSYASWRVLSVTGTPAENGGLQPGDILVPDGGSSLRLKQDAEPAGTRHLWHVTRGTRHFETTSTVGPMAANDFVLFVIFNVVRCAMVLVAIVVAVRRPELPAARALVTFLILIGLALVPFGAWLPDPAFAVCTAVRGPLEFLAFSQGLLFACLFPVAAPSGARATMRRINPWYTLVCGGGILVLNVWDQLANGLPDLGPVQTILEWSPLLYFFGMFRAFALSTRETTGQDRRRLAWVANSIALGFSGPLISTVLYVAFNRSEEWIVFLPVTLIAIPLGLAYTILRHRTVDLGFVISRALVLTILSALIVAAFGLLERALGKVFIDASHVASRSVEIALALGLGFSLRTLHARIERIVDRIFFRERQRALAALRAFGDDVYFITDPAVAIQRTVETAQACTDATDAALYLSADGAYVRAAAGAGDRLPGTAGNDDPLFVRLRATRKSEVLRDLGSAIDAEIAFPMFVRAALAGTLVLGPKRTGEAYDPEEIALLSDVAQRAGAALDALQTIALRRELDELMQDATRSTAAAR